ncbi:MAG: TIGR02265 family protein [Myxococcaceae bacterium]
MDADIERFLDDSRARLGALTNQHTLKGLFLRGYLEVFRGLGGEALATRCRRAMGLDRIFDFRDYPYATIVHLAIDLAPEMAPRYGGVHPWLYEMGAAATRSFLGSVPGRLFLATLRPSPKTMLRGMPQAIASTFSFGLRAVRFTSEESATFACREDFSAAPSNAGAVHAALAAVGAKDISVAIESQSLYDYDLLVSWK